ncbi:MAG: response regulator [[Ruminococcus] faecis]|nr:response regulator [Mediterraneibacter faecis]
MRIENRKKYIAVLMTILCIIMLFPQRISAVVEDPQRETVRVGFFEMNGYHMQDEDGNRSGYGYDTLRLMARYWDVDYEYIGYDKSWSEMQKMLEDGEMKGILPDYFRKLADYCGISYQFILCDSREEYVSYGTKGKQADLAIDARFPDDNLPESKDYGVTAPYITIKSAKVYRKDFNGEIKTVATVDQGDAGSIEDIYAPDAKKIIYPSREDAMEAVKAGDADMTLKMLVQLHPRALLILTGVMLLLVIIVGVQWLKLRGKNNELKVSFDKINRDKHVLDKLCTDYTAVYHVELNSGEFETLKIMRSSNADEVMRKAEKGMKDFDEYSQYYAQHYLAEEDRTEFIKWISCANLKAELHHTDRVAYNYKSVPGTYGKQFFSVQVINIYEDAQKMYVLMGFRYIDEIIEKEKEIQKRLQDALDELQLNNEIISAISKNYCYIARIDLRKDFFEEISNDEEMHRLTGNSGCASEMLRKDCEMQVAPEYRAYLYPFLDTSTLKERLQNEEYVSTEYRMCDGSWHRLRFIVKKRDEAGNVTHVLCTVREISDSKRREEDLLFAADAAKRESEMKTRFLATMSHDIRTPLNGIIGLVNLAEQHAEDTKMLKEIRDKMMKSLKYLVSLVNDVLDMNKIQSGDFKSKEIIFDGADMMRKILRIYDQKAVEKGIRLEVDWEKCSVRYPILLGNPVYFGRILASIMDNAIKFSSMDSTITVWGREDILENDQAVLTIWCKDQGIGMSEEFIEHAFDMFAQEKESSRSQYEGTGLGLTIAKALADKMGGTIEFQSKQGVGTTAIIKIPFKLGPQDIRSKTTNYDNVSVEGMQVLVVDDNELNVEIAKCMLENNGMKVTCAADGQEAVELFEKSEPGYYGAIFMDVMMPRMDGLEATKTIRNMKRSDAWNVPIIAISANAFIEDILNSKQAGMNAHLAKPLDVNKLLEALKKCLAENSELKIREDL